MFGKLTTNILLLNVLTTSFVNCIGITPADGIQEDSKQYKTIDELLHELKIERNRIEQQRLEELRLKKLEEEKISEEKPTKVPQNDSFINKEINTKAKDDEIPKLIVRLRGKHANKYLSRYSFKRKNDNTEKVVEREVITDYSKLLKRPSLKVRPNEKLNFEFSEEPQKMKVLMVDGDNSYELKTMRNSIAVPNIDKKVVLKIIGEYKDGFIEYVVVLDVRQPK